MVAVAILMTATPAVAADRPVIRSQSDLPPVRFTFEKPPSQVLASSTFVETLPAVRREGERLLRDYDIQNRDILSKVQLGLAAVAVLDGRKADAERLIATDRAGESKPQRQRLAGLMTDLAAATLDAPLDARCGLAVSRLDTLLAGADPAVVRDDFLSAARNIQIADAPYFAGAAAGVFDPIVQQRGSLDVLQELDLARWRVMIDFTPPCRTPLNTAARRWLNSPVNQPTDIWPSRQPPAAAFANAKPVVVAVWDSGYDATLFPGQLARDPAEPLDGRDNDGDGVIDDTNGPTYDVQLRPRTAAIMPPTKFLQGRLASQMAYDKGELDLQFGFDTPEAKLFADFARTASVADQGEELLASEENGGRTHGTACASEIADGAPFVRLYNVAALPWGRGEDKLEVPYDEATITRWADVIDRVGARMRGANVRIVSMSWALTADEITQQLLDHGLEIDAERARTRGSAMQTTIADALRAMMSASPNILFVVAAGNSNQSDESQANAFQKFILPNLMIVGATGTSGRPTSFTVFGKGVAIYAQGQAVPLRWPGDIVLHESGTSMAAPLVARAAAQMLAVRPTLTAIQVREGLLASATSGEGGLKLVHPAAATSWAFAH